MTLLFYHICFPNEIHANYCVYFISAHPQNNQNFKDVQIDGRFHNNVPKQGNNQHFSGFQAKRGFGNEGNIGIRAILNHYFYN